MGYDDLEKRVKTAQASELLGSYKPLLLIKAWKLSAGPVFLEKAKFMGIQNTAKGPTLMLSIQDPMWRQEFSFHAPTLLESFNETLIKLGLPAHEVPRACSLMRDSGSPLKPSHPQKSRQK